MSHGDCRITKQGFLTSGKLMHRPSHEDMGEEYSEHGSSISHEQVEALQVILDLKLEECKVLCRITLTWIAN